MAHIARCVGISVMIATIAGVVAARAEPSQSRVSVGIQERTAVDAEAIADALDRVTRIYRNAGVEIVWRVSMVGGQAR